MGKKKINSLEARPSSEVGYINNVLGDLARIYIQRYLSSLELNLYSCGTAPGFHRTSLNALLPKIFALQVLSVAEN